MHVCRMLREQVVAFRDQRRCQSFDARSTPHRFDAEMIAAHLIQHDHVKRRRRCPFFDEATYMEALHVWSPMNELVHGSWITVEREDHRRVFGEVLDKRGFIQPM